MRRMLRKTISRDMIRGFVAAASLAGVWLVASAPYDAGW